MNNCFGKKERIASTEGIGLINGGSSFGYGTESDIEKGSPSAPTPHCARATRVGIWAAKLAWWATVTPLSSILFAIMAAAKKTDPAGQWLNFTASFAVNIANTLKFGSGAAGRMKKAKENIINFKKMTGLERWYTFCFFVSFGLVIYTAAVGWELGGEGVKELDDSKIDASIRKLGFWTHGEFGVKFAQIMMAAITFATRYVGMQRVLYEVGVSVNHWWRSQLDEDFRALKILSKDVARHGFSVVEGVEGDSEDTLSEFGLNFYTAAKSNLLTLQDTPKRDFALNTFLLLFGVLGFLQVGWVNMAIAEKGLQTLGWPHGTLPVLMGALATAIFILFTNMRLVPQSINLVKVVKACAMEKNTLSARAGVYLLALLLVGSASAFAWLSGAGYYFLARHYGDLILEGPAEGGLDAPNTREFLLHGNNPFSWVFQIPLPGAEYSMQAWAAIANIYGIMGYLIEYYTGRLEKSYPANPMLKKLQEFASFEKGDRLAGVPSTASGPEALEITGLAHVVSRQKEITLSPTWVARLWSAVYPPSKEEVSGATPMSVFHYSENLDTNWG